MEHSNRIVMMRRKFWLKNSQFVAHEVIFKTKHLLHLSGQQFESTMSIETVSEAVKN